MCWHVTSIDICSVQTQNVSSNLANFNRFRQTSKLELVVECYLKLIVCVRVLIV
jgi:hypothetical protein